MFLLQLRSLYAMALSAMAVTAARRCIVSLLLSWPENVQLSGNTVHGEDNLVMLSKIVVAGSLPRASSWTYCSPVLALILIVLCAGERQFSMSETAELSASASPLVLGIRRQLARMISVECGPANTSRFLVRFAANVLVCWRHACVA